MRTGSYPTDLNEYEKELFLNYLDGLSGIWLLYADANYNVANSAGSNYWVFGDNFCTDVPAGFDNMASSLRYTGKVVMNMQKHVGLLAVKY